MYSSFAHGIYQVYQDDPTVYTCFLNQLICLWFQTCLKNANKKRTPDLQYLPVKHLQTLVDSEVELRDVTLDFVSRLPQWNWLGGLVLRWWLRWWFLLVGRWKFFNSYSGFTSGEMYAICGHLQWFTFGVPHYSIVFRYVGQASCRILGWCLDRYFCIPDSMRLRFL